MDPLREKSLSKRYDTAYNQRLCKMYKKGSVVSFMYEGVKMTGSIEDIRMDLKTKNWHYVVRVHVQEHIESFTLLRSQISGPAL